MKTIPQNMIDRVRDYEKTYWPETREEKEIDDWAWYKREILDKMTPEEKAEYEAKNAKLAAENKRIGDSDIPF